MIPPTSSLWPRRFSPSHPARPSLCALASLALRGTPGNATMTTPGGAGTPLLRLQLLPCSAHRLPPRVGAPTLLPPRRYGAPALTLSWRRCRHSKRRRWKGAWWIHWLVSSRDGVNRSDLRRMAARNLRRFYGRGPSGRRPFASPHPKRLSTLSASPGPIRVGPTGRPGISVTMRYGGIGAERGGMDARKRDDTYHRGRGGRYIGHSPTAGTLGSCHSPGPLPQGISYVHHGNEPPTQYIRIR